MKSIGIEARPEMTKGDQKEVAELVADLWERFGVLPIIEHRDIVATSCPAKWSAKKVEKQAKEIYNSKGANGIILPSRGYFDIGDTGSSVKRIQRYLNKQGAKLDVDGIYGAKTKKAVKKWQKAVKITADGLWGKECQKHAK